MDIRELNYNIDLMVDRGYSNSQIDDWLRQAGVDPNKLYRYMQEQKQWGAGDLGRSIAQGLALNFWDEIEGGIRSLGEDDYQTARDKVRADMARFSEHHPGKAFLGEAAGIVAPALVTGGLALGSAVPRGAAASVGRAAGAGALGGAIEGAGIAGEMEDVPGYMLGGGLLGGAAGAAIPPLVSGVSKGVGALGNLARESVSRSPASGAGRRVMRAMTEDATTPGEVAARMQAMGPGTIPADVAGQSTLDLLDTAVQRRGRNISELGERLNQRARAQQSRLMDDLAETTGVETNFWDDFLELDRVIRENANRDYTRAYAVPIDFTDDLGELIKRPDISDAWRIARRSAANQGRVLPEYFTYDMEGNITGTVKYPDMEAWDWIKRGLDSLAEKNTDTLTQKVNAAGRDTLMLKDELIGILDKANPAYNAARSRYAGTAALKTAMEKGRKIFSADAEITRRMVDKMGDSEKTAYIRGAARAIRDKILAAGEGDSVARRAIFKSPLYRERLRPAFPSEETYQAFLDAMKREETYQYTRNYAFRGAQTAKRLQSTADEGLDPSELAAVATGGSGALVDAGLRFARRVFGPAMSNADANEIARILGAADPQVMRDALRVGRLHPLWERIGRIVEGASAMPGRQGYVSGAGVSAATMPE